MHGLACRRHQKYYGNSQAGTRRIGGWKGDKGRGGGTVKWWFLNRFQILMSEETQRMRVRKIKMKTGGSTDHPSKKRLTPSSINAASAQGSAPGQWGMELLAGHSHDPEE